METKDYAVRSYNQLVVEPIADLHVHSSASDGAFTPSQVIRAAHDFGLSAVAIADHDTIAGLDDALREGKSLGIEVVPAVEISAIHDDKTEVHVLGYFFDHNDSKLIASLRVLTDARWERGIRMVEKLNDVGVKITVDRVKELANGGSVGRPHVARAIWESGAAGSIDSAFGKFLQENGPGYVPRYKVTPIEAMEMIVSAGGVACCAHPAKLKNEAVLIEMVNNGLKAIEVFHPDHTSATRRYFKRFAQKRNLIVTGGSDAHGYPNTSHPGIGEVTVPYESVIALKQASAFFK